MDHDSSVTLGASNDSSDSRAATPRRDHRFADWIDYRRALCDSLSLLPQPFGSFLPFLSLILFGYLARG